MSLVTIGSVLVGFALLLGGAELLVRGAAAIAARFKISPLLIGLTVVAFGTSAPELAVGVKSAFAGSDVALGNVVGSNIANILLILGASALIGGLGVALRIIRLDIPILIGISLLTFALAIDGSIGRIDGALLAACLVAYIVWTIRASRKERAAAREDYETVLSDIEGLSEHRPLVVDIVFTLVGLGLLVGGAQLLVSGATSIAADLGVSDLIIGLTVVAIGTSLPELATSVLAAVRGERDIAIGSAVGSNVLNLLLVLGLSGLVAPKGIAVADGVLSLDLPVMVVATLALLPVCWNGLRIARWEGAVFVGAYATYVTYLVLTATDHSAAGIFALVALIMAPLLVVTFGVLGVQGWRRHRASMATDGATTPS